MIGRHKEMLNNVILENVFYLLAQYPPWNVFGQQRLKKWQQKCTSLSRVLLKAQNSVSKRRHPGHCSVVETVFSLIVSSAFDSCHILPNKTEKSLSVSQVFRKFWLGTDRKWPRFSEKRFFESDGKKPIGHRWNQRKRRNPREKSSETYQSFTVSVTGLIGSGALASNSFDFPLLVRVTDGVPVVDYDNLWEKILARVKAQRCHVLTIIFCSRSRLLIPANCPLHDSHVWPASPVNENNSEVVISWPEPPGISSSLAISLPPIFVGFLRTKLTISCQFLQILELSGWKPTGNDQNFSKANQ